MRRFLLAVVLLFVPMFARAQGNIQTLYQTGPLHFARNIPWAMATGNQNSGLIFTWTPVPGTQYMCATVTNKNPVSSHNSITASTYTVLDPTPMSTLLSSQGVGLVNSSFAFLVSNWNSMAFQSFVTGQVNTRVFASAIPAATQVAFQISGASGTGGVGDNLDFIEVDSPTPCVSPQMIPNQLDATISRGCASTWEGTVATGTQVLISSSNPAFLTTATITNASPRWHICSYSISGAAATTSANVAFLPGSAQGTCAGSISANSAWVVKVGVGIPNYALSGNNRELFSLLATNGLCVQDGGTTTGVTVSVSYDYW